MPIKKQEFKLGREFSDAQWDIVTLLRDDSEHAYSVNELVEKIGGVDDLSRFYGDQAASREEESIQAVKQFLEDLVEEGYLKSKTVNTLSGDKEEYYRWQGRR